jgi:hypothetical protein
MQQPASVQHCACGSTSCVTPTVCTATATVILCLITQAQTPQQHTKSAIARQPAIVRHAAPHCQQRQQQRSNVVPWRHSKQQLRVTPAASSSSAGSAGLTNSSSSSLSRGPVLVVPAFYLDAQAFKPLVQELRSRGFNAALPPIRCGCYTHDIT